MFDLVTAVQMMGEGLDVAVIEEQEAEALAMLADEGE